MPNAIQSAMVRRDGPTGPALNPTQPAPTGGMPAPVSHAAAPNAYMSAMPAALAQARANIAAQYALAAGSVDSAQKAGANMAGQLPGQYGDINKAEGGTLAALAGATTQAATQGGLGMTRSMRATTDPIARSGNMATSFAQGAVPLIQQGISARATAQHNALAIQQNQAESELAMKEAEWQQHQQEMQQQREWQRQDQAAGYAHDEHMANKQFKDTLSLKQLEQGAEGGFDSLDKLTQTSLMRRQETLDEGGVTSYNALEEARVKKSPQYAYMMKQPPKQRALMLQQYARLHAGDPEGQLIYEVIKDSTPGFNPEGDYLDHPKEGSVGPFRLDPRWDLS